MLLTVGKRSVCLLVRGCSCLHGWVRKQGDEQWQSNGKAQVKLKGSKGQGCSAGKGAHLSAMRAAAREEGQ